MNDDHQPKGTIVKIKIIAMLLTIIGIVAIATPAQATTVLFDKSAYVTNSGQAIDQTDNGYATGAITVAYSWSGSGWAQDRPYLNCYVTVIVHNLSNGYVYRDDVYDSDYAAGVFSRKIAATGKQHWSYYLSVGSVAGGSGHCYGHLKVTQP